MTAQHWVGVYSELFCDVMEGKKNKLVSGLFYADVARKIHKSRATQFNLFRMPY